MIIFAEKNQELREMFKEAFPEIEVVEDMFSVTEPKKVVSCSNKWLSMGGGLDALIAKHYPEDCKYAQDWIKGDLNNRYGYLPPGKTLSTKNVVFAVTVDDKLNADKNAIAHILDAIFSLLLKDKETYVFTGLGTGIGGLDNKSFINLCKQAYEQNKN